MFTNTKCSIYAGQDKVYTESVCLSTDVKPTTGIANGSVCLEMNTGKKYMFNEDSGEWVEVPSSGGGGGGGGGGDVSTAQVTLNLTALDFDENPVTVVAEAIISEFLFESVPYTSENIEVVNHEVNVLMSQNYGVINAIIALDENDNVYPQVNGTPTTTGGVTWNAETTTFEVTGDGTITATLVGLF